MGFKVAFDFKFRLNDSGKFEGTMELFWKGETALKLEKCETE